MVLAQTFADDLEVSIRLSNAMQNSHIKTLGDLCRLTEAEVKRLPNVGQKTLIEIKELLIQNGCWFAEPS